jgi:hypothetical protein
MTANVGQYYGLVDVTGVTGFAYLLNGHFGCPTLVSVHRIEDGLGPRLRLP